MMRAALLLASAALLLAGCGGPAPLSDGRWVGTVTPQGAAAHGPANEEICVGPTHAVLSFHGRRFQFEPNEGTLVMPGFVDPAGKLNGSLTRPGVGHAPAWSAVFTGQVKESRIEGLLALPGCRADVKLNQVSGPNLFQDLLRD